MGSAALAVALLSPSLPSQAADALSDPRGFLTSEAGLEDADLQLLDRGGVLSRVLDSQDRSEVYSLAAFRVRASAAKVRARLLDVEGRRRDDEVLQIGLLGAPPTSRDMDQMTLDPRDVEGLKKCHLGECTLRISAAMMERFQTQVDWTTPDRASKVNALLRESLADYAAAYIAQGNAGLIEYRDNKDANRLADTLHTLVDRSVYLKNLAPDLVRYLLDFPGARPSDSQDVFYWLKEKFWLKNVISLNQLTLLERTGATGPAIIATTKQLFADHFYEASLGLTLFVESPDPLGGYLIFLNRTRADVRRTGFNWIERALAKRLVRGRLSSQFKTLKSKLDPTYSSPSIEDGP